MNNCRDIHCPITIPQGLRGPASGNGTDGTDGVALLVNNIAAVSSGTTPGLSTLSSGVITAGEVSAGDVLELETVFFLPLSGTFVGTISLVIGTTTIASLDIDTSATDGAIIPPGVAASYYKLNVKTLIRSLVSQLNFPKRTFFGLPTTSLDLSPTASTEDFANNVTCYLKVQRNSGSTPITMDYFIVYNFKA